MQENDLAKEKTRKIDRAYYKPHFGPEETNEIVKQHMDRAKEIQEVLRYGLSRQLDE